MGWCDGEGAAATPKLRPSLVPVRVCLRLFVLFVVSPSRADSPDSRHSREMWSLRRGTRRKRCGRGRETTFRNRSEPSSHGLDRANGPVNLKTAVETPLKLYISHGGTETRVCISSTGKVKNFVLRFRLHTSGVVASAWHSGATRRRASPPCRPSEDARRPARPSSLRSRLGWRIPTPSSAFVRSRCRRRTSSV